MRVVVPNLTTKTPRPDSIKKIWPQVVSPKTLSPNEELRLLDWAYTNRSFRDYVAILTILQTGLHNSVSVGLLYPTSVERRDFDAT